jgi:hypothetical protein
LPAFVEHLRRLELLETDGDGRRGHTDTALSHPDGPFDARPSDDALPARLGGWLKMGMVGTVPAAGRVLLVGDAAGLVNPLQGEGIAQAVTSGWAAAEAVVAGPDRAALRYRRALRAAHLPYFRIAASLHRRLVCSPRQVSALGRLLSAPGVSDALAGGWAVFWNELVRGAPSGVAPTVARAASTIGELATGRGELARWFDETLERR